MPSACYPGCANPFPPSRAVAGTPSSPGSVQALSGPACPVFTITEEKISQFIAAFDRFKTLNDLILHNNFFGEC